MAIVVDNLTMFPHLRFSNLDAKGDLFGVLMIKAAYDIAADGSCVLASEQEPFNFSDRCRGEVHATSLRHPSDLVPYKPTTDVVVDAVAHAPGGKARTDWICSIDVADRSGRRVAKSLRITGPRAWRPKFAAPEILRARMSDEQKRALCTGWEMSGIEPVTRVPIAYEFAYGGMVRRPADDGDGETLEAYEYNPVGRGWVHERWTPVEHPVPAPQIEALDAPIATAGRHYKPEGFGPIPPAWLPRRALGGTYDQHWNDHIWPNWAPDYDFAFFQSAHPDLISASPFVGDLLVASFNLRPEPKLQSRRFVVACPRLCVDVTTQAEATTTYRPQLDTIILDLAHDRLDRCSVQCAWRLLFDPEATRSITVKIWPGEDALESEAALVPPPHPSAVARFDPRFKEVHHESADLSA